VHAEATAWPASSGHCGGPTAPYRNAAAGRERGRLSCDGVIHSPDGEELDGLRDDETEEPRNERVVDHSGGGGGGHLLQPLRPRRRRGPAFPPERDGGRGGIRSNPPRGSNGAKTTDGWSGLTTRFPPGEECLALFSFPSVSAVHPPLPSS
jgi:hypothetical protein